MSKHLEVQRKNLLKNLMAHIEGYSIKNKQPLLLEFAKRYFSAIAYEDLAARSFDDLFSMMMSHWQLVHDRAPKETRIHIFNPDLTKDGWQSNHTVIQISHDNMPFLIDTVRMAIARENVLIYLMIYTGGFNVVRSKKNEIKEILPPKNDIENTNSEAPIYIEIEKITDEKKIRKLRETLKRVLLDNTMVVLDWGKMRARMEKALVEFEENPPQANQTEIEESRDFLRWLLDEHFIFLGCQEFKLIKQGKKKFYQSVSPSGLGLLRTKTKNSFYDEIASLPYLAEKVTKELPVLLFAKTSVLATVHRDTYADYIGIKTFDKKGDVVGEIRFIGLYSSIVYNGNPKNIPFIRQKIKSALEKSGLNLQGHAGKSLRYIIENLPRNDLLQAPVDELVDLSMGILQMQDRQQVRLFMRRDIYGRYYSCLVYIPRDRFGMRLSEKIGAILKEVLSGHDITFDVKLFESQQARIHYLVHTLTNENNVDEEALELKIILASRSWVDELRDLIIEKYGEQKGLSIYDRYRLVFPASYQEEYQPQVAVNFDIPHIEALLEGGDLRLSLYPATTQQNVLHFKLFRRNHVIQLSDVLPMLENLGLRVIEESPNELTLQSGTTIWLNDFEVIAEKGEAVDISAVSNILEDAFKAVWDGRAESDRFNTLVFKAQLSWDEIVMLRAYARYFKQIAFPFSHYYIAQTLINNAGIANLLAKLFRERFDPSIENRNMKTIQQKIEKALDDVGSLDEDRIIRRYMEIILATTRTNFYQKKPYLSFKLNPKEISDLPKPVLMFEIFVYSPRFEGIHLRGAKVARGGLRWSDRREDFRTEILGLVKAQQVKNAVIVPLGAKGGFVPKQLPEKGSRDEIMQEGISCYRSFICGLLDLTDNLVRRKVIPPKNVVRYDEDDTYLVVAADKGTATFSDIANGISAEYKFWLGDAFASGGSAGYDHKKMGITARGAWESVRRHFKEANIDIEKPFTVVGIGDMSGDVFGNGLLYSDKIKLVAAFNHAHIFIDPNPDSKKSFLERKRLFQLPRSTWEDYDAAKISAGGGVFSRATKSIKLSSEIKNLLEIKKDMIQPNELIRFILKANVDLLWNGGIGTYVKATPETDLQVGDRSNDSVRVNANELRCKVIGEGGNLGLTQLARAEYDLSGGRCYTDFIDNSAGVDCSDHEVNIKILLSAAMLKNEMTVKERNRLLVKMTQQVASLVLNDNVRQTRAVSMAYENAANNVDLYKRYIDDLAANGLIDREVEFLPSEEMLKERKAKNKGLTRSELAVLLSYSKIILKQEILKSALPEDPCFSSLVLQEFPNVLHETYYLEMQSHPLRREIIATHLTNGVIDEMGATFVYRLREETGASVSNVIKAFIIARKIFDRDHLQLSQLVRRATRWFLRNFDHIDIDGITAQFKPAVQLLSKSLRSYLSVDEGKIFDEKMADLSEQGVNKQVATAIAGRTKLLSSLDIVQAAADSGYSIRDIATTYFALDDRLGLGLLRHQIVAYQGNSKWDALARVMFRDELDRHQRLLTISLLKAQPKRKALMHRINDWVSDNEPLIKRWQKIVEDIRSADVVSPVMLSVALRELQTVNSVDQKGDL
jgi:glutamate dehydrogenase